MDQVEKEIYDIWRGVKKRCGLSESGYEKLDRTSYKIKEIKLDPTWFSFETFKRDMGARPSLKHSVDRIENDKGYGPTNCKWSTYKEQACNRDTNVWLEYRGQKKTLGQWAEDLNIPFNTFRSRVESVFKVKRLKNQQIEQLNKETGEVLNTFENGDDASKTSLVSQAAIRKCLCGHNASAGGFKWRYLKE
jgi:hypothetical protein